MNSNCQTGKTASRAAFTLIELMVVIMVIVILSAITMSLAKYSSWRSQKVKAGMERLKIQSALEEYRAVYGEYPIVGDPKHYPSDFEPDPDTSSNLPTGLRRVDLVNVGATTNLVNWESGTNKNVNPMMPGVERLPFTAAKGQSTGNINVDFRLTYPLMIRPKLEGRLPFMEFPKITVCFLTWANVNQADIKGYVGTNRYYLDKKRTTWTDKTYLKGDPVNRYVAIDPEMGRQWAYYSDNGTTYILTNGAAINKLGQYVGSVNCPSIPY